MITPHDHIEDILSLNAELSTVLQRYGLQAFSASSLHQASQAVGVPASFLAELLNMFDREDYLPLPFLYRQSVSTLLDYLSRTHSYYFDKRLPEIEQSIHNLLLRQGAGTTEIKALAAFFQDFRDELKRHIRTEEEQLFPYLRQLIEWHRHGLKRKVNGPLPYSLRDFVADHDAEAEVRLHETYRRLLAREDLCRLSGFRILLHQIRNFERDLRIHAFIEDHILIPKCIAMERILLDCQPLRAGLN